MVSPNRSSLPSRCLWPPKRIFYSFLYLPKIPLCTACIPTVTFLLSRDKCCVINFRIRNSWSSQFAQENSWKSVSSTSPNSLSEIKTETQNRDRGKVYYQQDRWTCRGTSSLLVCERWSCNLHYVRVTSEGFLIPKLRCANFRGTRYVDVLTNMSSSETKF